mgnify:CR=1 FL=1
MDITKKIGPWREVGKRLLVITIYSIIMALNYKSFVQAGDLFPGGFTGLTRLAQRCAQEFWGVTLPFAPINLVLNAIPAAVSFKLIGKRFTMYSCLAIVVSSIFTDLVPSVPVTEDILLICVFGGLVNGFAISLCLQCGASAGGTDFISIYYSEKKGVDAWNYILLSNVVILGTAGLLFGFDKALYSIIYQYTSTQIIQVLFKRYQKATLLIITSQPSAVYGKIRALTHHDATLLEGTGCYEGAERQILYSVIGREQVDAVIAAIHSIDPKAFINVINTEQINGRFYRTPTR